MKSEFEQPVTLSDVRHVEVSGDEKVVVLTAQDQPALEQELQLGDVGT